MQLQPEDQDQAGEKLQFTEAILARLIAWVTDTDVRLAATEAILRDRLQIGEDEWNQALSESSGRLGLPHPMLQPEDLMSFLDRMVKRTKGI